MSRALLAAGAALLVLAAPAPAAELHVGIPGRYFTPASLQAVAGDSVVWHNGSSEPHDVQGERVGPGEEIGRDFPEPGRVPYVCVLHPSMTGSVDVVPIALAGPVAPPAAGEPLVLDGRAPAGTGSVTVERDGVAAATVVPGPDGTFRYAAPAQSGTYRAVGDRGASPDVRIDVAERVDVGLRALFGRRFTTLRITTTPVRPGATVLLELWSRERFAWRRSTKATLDPRGATTLTLERRIRRRARVVLLAPDGRRVATSRQAFTWKLKHAPAGPPAPPPPHHHHGPHNARNR